MVAAVRRGRSKREVAREFGVALSTVQFWVSRARGERLNRVDWSDRASGPRHPGNRTPQDLEDRVLRLRQELRESDLGEFGAQAIVDALKEQGLSPVPALRTIGRILERRGVLDGRHRVRRPPPPAGWYLSDLAAGDVELDSFDIIEGLVIKGGPQVEVLTKTGLHSGFVEAWPMAGVTAKLAVEAILGHWRQTGLPAYAQFDNDTIFQGAHHHRDAVGRVTRLCLSLGVTPVFVPPREPGFQAAIEAFNGRWQAKVWSRFHYPSLKALRDQSTRYVAANRLRRAQRIDAAPARRSFPHEWTFDLQAHPKGRIIYLRRTGATGAVELLGHRFAVDPTWPHRLVRAEVDLEKAIRFYALRRRNPADQPLLSEVPYTLPHRRFKG
jgi:transposase